MCTLRGTEKRLAAASVTRCTAVPVGAHTVACNDHPPDTASIATWFGFGSLWPIEEEGVEGGRGEGRIRGDGRSGGPGWGDLKREGKRWGSGAGAEQKDETEHTQWKGCSGLQDPREAGLRCNETAPSLLL